MSPSSVFIFSLLIILHTGAQTTYYDDTLDGVEKQALLTFINTITHHPDLNWDQSSEPACAWRGVVCDPTNSTVLYLLLPAAGLTGEIPPQSIGMLTSLRIISLHNNYLSGDIPSDFASLKYLTSLYLHNNSFSGHLSYINADYLSKFNVSYNKLTGSIPYSLSKFPASAFFGNEFLCGEPLPPCGSSNPPVDYLYVEEPDPKMRRETVGVSTGSVLLLLIVVCSMGTKMYHQMKPPPSKALEMERKSKLVLFDDGIDLEDLLTTTVKVLGHGSVGTSYKQVLVRKNTTVVLKILKDVVVTEDKFKTTMEALGKMKSKYVVPLRAFNNYPKNEKLLVYDYMPAGSLSAHLHGSTCSVRTLLDLDHRMRIALSVTNGLAYLHLVGVVHGNIKSSNIFLQHETNNEVLLSDYGLYTLFRESSSLKVTGYWAPEVLESQKFTFESDVYSYGVLLLELLTGKTPINAEWVRSIVYKEPKVEVFDVELTRGHNIDKMVKLFEVVKDCVVIAPNERPQMRNVVSTIEKIVEIPLKGIR